MTLHQELAPLLEHLPAASLDDIAGTRRALLDGRANATVPWPYEARAVTSADAQVPGRVGDPDVAVRIYTPASAAGGVLVFMHGGAFVFGDLESEHGRCLEYAERAECVVVSVDYRLAPEDPYPCAIDDCTAALLWVAGHARDLGADPARIGVAGASAGGALAAGLCLRNRDEVGLALRLQLLVYPVVDDQASNASTRAFYNYPGWSGAQTEQMWRAYLGADTRTTSLYAAPARASSLAGLPPTYIVTADEDPLRDEGIDFARALLAAGIPTELHNFAGTFHGFDVLAPATAPGRRALDEQVRYLRDGFGAP